MAQLVYPAITSLDGYTADHRGNIDWSAPDPEVLRFVNDVERPLGTYFYGRRMYESMIYWENFGSPEDQRPEVRDFAELWRAADKVVYSRTLGAVSSARTRIERAFDPAAVRRMKDAAGPDVSVGGLRSRGSGHGGRTGRRGAPLRHSEHGRGRHSCPSRRAQTNLELMGVGPLHERDCPPPLPHRQLMFICSSRPRSARESSRAEMRAVELRMLRL